MKRSKGAGSVAQRSIRSRQSAKAIRQDDDASSQNSSHLDSDGSSSHPDSVSNDIFCCYFRQSYLFESIREGFWGSQAAMSWVKESNP